jgi:dephospho-CoA kinase
LIIFISAWLVHDRISLGQLVSIAISFGIGTYLPVIGITGGIASGKSTASQYAHIKLGYVLIDADKVAKEVVKKGTSGYEAIVRTFGPTVVDPVSGELDRKELGAIIFADIRSRKQLERITHPRILFKMMVEMIKQRICGKKVLIDVPLLFESKTPILYWMCKRTILINTTASIQADRLRSRNPDMSKEEIKNRINAQMSVDDKKKYADIVIDNNGTIEDLYRQLDIYMG